MKPLTAPFDIFDPASFAAAMGMIKAPDPLAPEPRALSPEEMAEGNLTEELR